MFDYSTFKSKNIKSKEIVKNIYKLKSYNRVIILCDQLTRIIDSQNYQLITKIDKGFTSSIKQINNQIIAVNNDKYGRINDIHDFNWIYNPKKVYIISLYHYIMFY